MTPDPIELRIAADLRALCEEVEDDYRRIFQTPEQVAAFGASMPAVQVDVRRLLALLDRHAPEETS